MLVVRLVAHGVWRSRLAVCTGVEHGRWVEWRARARRGVSALWRYIETGSHLDLSLNMLKAILTVGEPSVNHRPSQEQRRWLQLGCLHARLKKPSSCLGCRMKTRFEGMSIPLARQLLQNCSVGRGAGRGRCYLRGGAREQRV